MKGFSFIELVLVIALISLLSAMATPFVGSFILRSNWNVAVDRVASQVYKAQEYAMDGKSVSGSVVWGVCLTGSTYRLFNGSCASPNYKEDYLLPSGVTIGGLTSLTFGNLRGDPNSPASLTVSSSYGTNTITVNAAGMIQEN